MSNGARDIAQLGLGPRKRTLREAEFADNVWSDRFFQARQNLRLHQAEFLYPHSARDFNHSGVELERRDLGAPGYRLTDDLRPRSSEPYDPELSLRIEAIKKWLQSLIDLDG